MATREVLSLSKPKILYFFQTLNHSNINLFQSDRHDRLHWLAATVATFDRPLGGTSSASILCFSKEMRPETCVIL